jgi:hypothetical protein
VQINRYAKIQQWTFADCTFLDRKKGWIMRTHVEEIGDCVVHVALSLNWTFKWTISSMEKEGSGVAGNERMRECRLACIHPQITDVV